MRKKSITAITLTAGIAVAAVVALGVAPASAAGSKGNWYIIDAGSGDNIAPGTSVAFDYAVVGNPSPTYVSEDDVFTGSADATGVTQFIAPLGSEFTPSAWLASSTGGFKGSSKDVLLPPIALNTLQGGIGTVRANGGDYSLGFAFVKNNGLTIADGGVYYTKIHVTATTGAWTFDAPVVQPPVVTPTADPRPTATADVPLTAQVATPADGPLTLSVPSGASVALPSTTAGVSVSASLPTITVSDLRYSSHPGWNLTTSVAPFVSGGNTIAASALGVAPAKLTGPTTVTTGAATTAGSAVYPMAFASADNSATVGTSTYSGTLTFVPPAGSVVGNYTSKMTLTLVGK